MGTLTRTPKNDVLVLQEVLPAGDAWDSQKTRSRPDKMSGSGPIDRRRGAIDRRSGTLDKRPRPCRKSTAAGTKFTCFTGTKVQMLTSCQTSAAGPQEEEEERQSARCWEGMEHRNGKEQSACFRGACGSCKRKPKESQSNVIEP